MLFFSLGYILLSGTGKLHAGIIKQEEPIVATTNPNALGVEISDPNSLNAKMWSKHYIDKQLHIYAETIQPGKLPQKKHVSKHLQVIKVGVLKQLYPPAPHQRQGLHLRDWSFHSTQHRRPQTSLHCFHSVDVKSSISRNSPKRKNKEKKLTEVGPIYLRYSLQDINSLVIEYAYHRN